MQKRRAEVAAEMRPKKRKKLSRKETGKSGEMVGSPSDPDVHIPGAYHEESPLVQLPAGTTSIATVLTKPPARPRKTRRPPAQFQDVLPEPPQAVPASQRQLPTVYLMVTNPFETIANSFGLFRKYLFHPSHDPDEFVEPSDLSNITTPTSPPSPPHSEEINRDPPWPFATMSVWRLMRWMNNGSNSKSEGEVDRLVRNVLDAPDFRIEDLHNFSTRRENGRLDAADKAAVLKDNFQVASISIQVPTGTRGDSSDSRTYSVPGLRYRKLLNVVKAAFQDPLSRQFHFTPFTLMHRSPVTNEEQRVYGELYNSDEFIEEHKRVQNCSPRDDPGCKLEKVIAALMFWSDSTHLTNFGTAKLWPIYLYFGNLSKYIRSRPSSGACNHLAYIPSLPDSFESWISGWHPRWDTQRSQLMAHCRRELIQAVWKYILDDDFIHATIYGVVITCHDGIKRRIYPRIFTYSADYPEKVLLATIRDNGLCPCPRCLMPKTHLDRMGWILDSIFRTDKVRQYLSEKVQAARDLIYRLGHSVAGTRVNGLLKPTSSVATINSFFERVKQTGRKFDVSRMMVVDLLHEFELGVWKALLTHLIRILHAESGRPGALVDILNSRFRQVPTFGRFTIRRFHNNVSEMKKLAARDFEDILQCSIPVFEGLLPEPFNGMLLRLLYKAAEWHALAKLRMHSDSTLNLLEAVTREFGRLMRQFRDKTAEKYNTVELPSETARKRGTGPSKKELNLNTYKFHALGDYVATIRLFGTTDSYSTQVGELAHRLVKRLYGLTNKRDAPEQISRRYRRAHHFGASGSDESAPKDTDPSDSPELHYTITRSRNEPVQLASFSGAKTQDPATTKFVYKLRAHLLSRLLGKGLDGDDPILFTDEERNSVRIIDNTVFSAKQLSVNYTTYDVRRDRDTINPRTHPYVMLRSPEVSRGAHPYWYAQVLGIYHANVSTTHPAVTKRSAQHMEFLWVRWLGTEPGYHSGSKIARLPKVGFVEVTDEDAFGFLDPDLVIRGSHLIPAFNSGRTAALMPYSGPTVARSPNEEDDWMNFYVNIFVDRDMFIRYLGGGIGHLQQFPSAHDNNEGTRNSEDVEVEVDDFITEGNNNSDKGEESGDGDSGSEGSSEDDIDDEDREEDEATDDEDPDEHYLDEETGNGY